MSGENIQVNRTMVGILALACLAAAGVIVLFFYTDGSQQWLAAFVRVGLVLSAFWLALPSRKRAAAWANVSKTTLVGIILGVFLISWRPKVGIALVIVFAIVGFVLRPKGKQRPSTRQ